MAAQQRGRGRVTLTDFEPEFLPVRPEGERIWVVRASGGAYVGHFREHGLMAIGHLNPLGLRQGAISQGTLPNLEALLLRADSERSQGSLTSHANQARTFISGISEGDLIVTLNSGSISVGRVAGDAFISRESLYIYDKNGRSYALEHELRRKVIWGPRLLRTQVPAALQLTLLAHQTVFNIDDYWDSIYHLLYPCFAYRDHLYLSANIKQTLELDNYSLSQFFSMLSAIERTARDLAEGLEVGHTPKRHREDLNLTTKAEFMSPGTIWAQVAMDSQSLLWCAVIYVMLFGGDLKFFKTDGLLDTHTRQKIWDVVIKIVKDFDFSRVQKRLRVDIPRVDTSKIDPPKPKRIRKAKIKRENEPAQLPQEDDPDLG
ncbi:hypothetical protein EZ313_22170 [Ramlibacter henchirensis]|uniref:Uncharacterized protein n=2 Tax=Ramlibacter henchirensis TaxID=204072 RepID=A0A4Z0BKH3_9BURK|nr:hypothetical protein EZ313_22170 [Ramlibacter henchirensis]